MKYFFKGFLLDYGFLLGDQFMNFLGRSAAGSIFRVILIQH